jgi:hypothetical protein
MCLMPEHDGDTEFLSQAVVDIQVTTGAPTFNRYRAICMGHVSTTHGIKQRLFKWGDLMVIRSES